MVFFSGLKIEYLLLKLIFSATFKPCGDRNCHSETLGGLGIAGIGSDLTESAYFCFDIVVGISLLSCVFFTKKELAGNSVLHSSF